MACYTEGYIPPNGKLSELDNIRKGGMTSPRVIYELDEEKNETSVCDNGFDFDTYNIVCLVFELPRYFSS